MTLRDLVQRWRTLHIGCQEDFYYDGFFTVCADELEEILNDLDNKPAPAVDGVSNPDARRGTYYPDRKVVGS